MGNAADGRESSPLKRILNGKRTADLEREQSPLKRIPDADGDTRESSPLKRIPADKHEAEVEERDASPLKRIVAEEKSEEKEDEKGALAGSNVEKEEASAAEEEEPLVRLRSPPAVTEKDTAGELKGEQHRQTDEQKDVSTDHAAIENKERH